MRTEYTNEAAKQHLLTAFNLLAPDGKAQKAIVKCVKELEHEHTHPDRILTEIAAAILDGLRYGNWRG
jgi:hypothetical protein